MSHDVFVSYPSVDKSIADAAVAALEARGLRCWYAPRDVAPGSDWAGAIVEAIGASRLMVLVFSEATNASDHILREVRQAADAHVPILPFRTTPQDPNDSLRYYIGGTHWLDALTDPLEQHLDRLVDTAQRVLDGAAADELATVRTTGAAPPPPTTGPPPPPTAGTSRSSPGGRRPSPKVLGIAGAAVALAVVAVIALVSLGGGADDEGTQETEGTDQDDGWRQLSFTASDPRLWDASDEGAQTAVQQTDSDAFAWSTEPFDGDVSVRLDLASPGVQSSGCVILFGGGQPFHTQGSLIFCVEWDVVSLEKHTTYHDGENLVTYAEADVEFPGRVHQVRVDIEGDVATMSVDGGVVLSTVFDPEEFDRSGRIGLHKKAWIEPEVTFSDVEVHVPDDGAQAAPDDEDPDDCALDTGADPNHFPVQSTPIGHAVDIDGTITSSTEWAEASCVDLRMHFGVTVDNPTFHQARWWFQNDDENLYVLARVPAELGFATAYANYFWPEYVGTWANSDAIAIDADGSVSDSGQWDELQFHDDVEADPPGTADVVGATTEDAEFVWVELQHPLDSGDGHDWALEPGGTYGDNPRDSFLVGVDLRDGSFLRYLQLTIGTP